MAQIPHLQRMVRQGFPFVGRWRAGKPSGRHSRATEHCRIPRQRCPTQLSSFIKRDDRPSMAENGAAQPSMAENDATRPSMAENDAARRCSKHQ